MKILFYWQIFKVQLNVLKSVFYTSKSLKSKYAHFLLCNTNRCIYLPVDHLYLICEINKTLLTRYFMALFITLGLISRPSSKMLSLAQHADYAQHLSVYAVSCIVALTNLHIWVQLICELRTSLTHYQILVSSVSNIVIY